jgi:hypothetical protein
MRKRAAPFRASIDRRLPLPIAAMPMHRPCATVACARRALLLLACALTLSMPDAGAQVGSTATAAAAARASGGNVYVAGPTLRVTEPVAGDLFAAGGTLAIERPVGHDAALVGGDISVTAPIGEDLRAAGGQVSVDAPVAGEAHLAAGRVRIGPAGSIAGTARLAGGQIEVLGRLAGGSAVYAGHAVIDGAVDGDLRVRAGTLSVGPNARIAGRLIYQAREPLEQDARAVVGGSVVREPLPERATPPPPAPRSSGLVGGLLWLVGLALAGAVWRLVFPRAADGAEGRLERLPWRSLGIGALVVLATPPAALLLLLTIVGAPLALALLAAYGLVLLLGYLVTAGALGDRLLRATGAAPTPTFVRRWLALAAALLARILIGLLPVVGWLVSLAALMAGAGALVDRLVTRPAPA